MRLNADFSERIVVRPGDVPWIASPTAGVERRLLDRIGDEVARATSLVRYAPRSRFPAHVHGGGEELLVVEGVLADEAGLYPAGCYVRNPPGSRHAPSTDTGCVLFVKLWQFDPDDKAHIVLDTREGAWSAQAGGVSRLGLHAFGGERVAMERWAPGTRVSAHAHEGGEETLVLDGVFEDEAGRYPAGTWIRNPRGSRHAPFTTQGCVLYVKSGHLPAG
ncbi:MAG TPA: cupin domain-containing protein [Usitatibacter sp.]|jgi:anti-sigma factor ChrR (cupin superfamily)|nr:cupin domain-containing protein [Usitatibacter sp.]